MTMKVGHGRLVLVTKGDNAAVQHLAVLEDIQGKHFIWRLVISAI